MHGMDGGTMGASSPKAMGRGHGAGTGAKWFVPGLSLVPALSVSTGLVSSVARQTTSSTSVPRSELMVTSGDTSIQSEHTKDLIQVSGIAMLDSLEGGMVTESEDGLVVMFEAEL